MAADDAGPGTENLQVAAALVASSAIGAPLFVAAVVRMVLFGINPRGIELPGYETEIVFAFVAAFAAALLAVVLVLRRLRARGDRVALRIPYMVLVAQIVLGVLAVAALVFTP